MAEAYDLAVAYRIYPLVSKTPAVYSDDKLKLSELCLKSFKESLGDLKVKIWVLLDNCPKEYSDLFRKYFKEKDLEFINLPGIGNAGTFKLQTEILLKQNISDYIYFAEDDYFYLPCQFSEMLDFIKSNHDAHFVSPYDHPDYYTMEIHKYKPVIRFNGRRHWRTSATTCMTFLTTKTVLRKSLNTFLTYTKKNYDTSIWLSITKFRLMNPINIINQIFTQNYLLKIYAKSWLFTPLRNVFGKRYKLWSPIPSIATHIESDFLAPGIEWSEWFKK